MIAVATIATVAGCALGLTTSTGSGETSATPVLVLRRPDPARFVPLAIYTTGARARAALFGWTISVTRDRPAGSPESLEGNPAFAWPDGKTLYFRTDPKFAISLGVWEHLVRHELGHMVDVECLDDTQRQQWAAEHGQAGRWWWDGTYPYEQSPAELWADAVAGADEGRPMRADWASIVEECGDARRSSADR